jgi:hypothetical protein
MPAPERTVGILDVQHVEVGERSLEALVRVVDDRYLRTSAASDAVGRAVVLLPGLRRHRCENDAGLDILRELADTETPHLVEHVAVEIMAMSGSPRTCRGTTEWDFARDGQGVFRIRMEFDDDLVALGALSAAVEVVEWLFDPGGVAVRAPDVSGIVERLRELRRR